jgi:P4 family phage/plasmid primase-like protien
MNKTKKVIKQSENNIFAKKYSNAGFIPFNLSINVKDDGKKILKNVPAFSNIDSDNYVDYINDITNAMAIRLGHIIDDDHYVVLLDIDNKEQENVNNGLTKWKELIKNKTITTPTQKTGNDGLHYLFKVDTETFESLPAAITELIIDGEKYSIDFKGKNQFALVEPSKYDNKFYKWIVDFSTDIQVMPRWILKYILNHKNVKNLTKNKKKATKVIKDIIIDDDDEIENINENNCTLKVNGILVSTEHKTLSDILHISDVKPPIDMMSGDKNINNSYDLNRQPIELEIIKLLNMLSNERVENYTEWVNVGMCLKNINTNYLKLWSKWSAKSGKYNSDECMSKWNSFKVMKKSGFNIKNLVKWAQEDSPKEFTKVFEPMSAVINYINENRKYFEPNDMEIDNIYTDVDYHCIKLKDEYCPISNDNHDTKNISFEITPYESCFKCAQCFGKRFVCKHRPSPNDMKIMFNQINIQNVQNLQIFNCGEHYDDMIINNTKIENINFFENITLNNLVVKSLNGTHYNIAQLVYYLTHELYKLGTDNEWYFFENHRWGQSMKLRNFISADLPTYYTRVLNFYEKRNNDGDKQKIFKITKIMDSLETTSVKSAIMTELIEIHTTNKSGDNIIDLLDSKPFLVGFNNGVYDFTEMIFRDGKPGDYIMSTCKYDYVRNKKQNEKLMKFLTDIQPNPDNLRYLITFLSTCLIGINILELFTVFTGDKGRNGKSKLIELIKYTLGDYFASASCKLLTNPRPDSTSPDPLLYKLYKKRFLAVSEPEKKDKLNSGFIKFISGNDSMYIRKCHSNDEMEFKANFVTVLVCNDIPDVDEIDNAFSKRLRCVNFPTEFTKNPVKANEKLINEKLSLELPEWKQDFMILLINACNDFIKNDNNLIPTPGILEWNEQYNEKTDNYLSYLNECTEFCDKVNMHTSTLYENFKKWFKINFPNEKIPNNKIFVSGIRKYKITKSVRIGDKVTLGLINIKLKKYTM